MFKHQLAVGGQADATVVTINQVATQAAFQCLDTAAQSRLAKVHGLGGTGEMAVLGKGDKVAELA